MRKIAIIYYGSTFPIVNICLHLFLGVLLCKNIYQSARFIINRHTFHGGINLKSLQNREKLQKNIWYIVIQITIRNVFFSEGKSMIPFVQVECIALAVVRETVQNKVFTF